MLKGYGSGETGFRAAWQSRLLLCLVALLAVGALSAAASEQGLLIRFETIKTTSAGVVVTTEAGTYLIAPDGKCRKEVETAIGEHLGEIRDTAHHRVVKLDFTGKQALVGSDAFPWPGPNSKGKSQAVEPGSVNGYSGSNEMSLGTKLVEGLNLTGTRTTFQYVLDGQSFTNTVDLWFYAFPDRTVFPVILERRFETPEETTETRVTSVQSVPTTDSQFAIPSDFAVVRLSQ